MIIQTTLLFDVYTVIMVVTDEHDIIYFFEKGGDWWSTYDLNTLYSSLKSAYCSAHFVGQYSDVCKWINERNIDCEIIKL